MACKLNLKMTLTLPNAPGRTVSRISQERPFLQKTNPNHHSFIARAQNPPSENEPAPYEFTYMGSDGRLKATFEQAANSGFRTADPFGAHPAAPWEFGYQVSERDSLWNDELAFKLKTRIAADKLNIPDDDVAARIESLCVLLPEIVTKLPGMHINTVIRLLGCIDSLPQQLVNLKETFPSANVSKLVVRAPELVLGMESELLRIIAAQLEEMLPTLDVGRLVEENPLMLDVEEFRLAMAEAQRIMPSLDIQKAMGSDPQIILSFQRGSQLIPYDSPNDLVVAEESGDDEYAAYYD